MPIRSTFAKLKLGKFFAAALLLVVLGSAEPALAVLWGNTYLMNGAGSAVVSPTATHWVTFTATEDMLVSGARFNANSVTGAPLVTVSLRGVNGSGIPTGAVLGSGTVSPVGGGWHGVTLSGTGVSLNSGVVYAMEVATATPSTSLAWRYNGGPTGGIQPYGDPDPDFKRGANAGAPAAGSDVFILETDIGRSVGQPYVSSPAVNIALPTTTQAQRFKFDLAGAGGESVVESVRVRLSIAATAPSNDVTVKLISSTGTVLATSARDLSGEAAGAADFTFDLNTTVNLTDDADYYIGMYSNGSAGNSVRWFGWDVTDHSDYISASFQGADSNAVLFGSQSDYTGSPTETAYRDYAFALNMIPEPLQPFASPGWRKRLALHAATSSAGLIGQRFSGACCRAEKHISSGGASSEGLALIQESEMRDESGVLLRFRGVRKILASAGVTLCP